jgi:hypothetical protein
MCNSNDKCYDSNGTELNVNDTVMYVEGRKEIEGCIARLLPDNKLVIDTEFGGFTVEGKHTYYLV